MPSRIEHDARTAALRAQCGGPRDGALLRVLLGQALAASGEHLAAANEFEAALRFDAHYSAAWKFLGKARLLAGNRAAAADAWRRGIAVADARGDAQASKEMRVFLRRIEGHGPAST